MLRGWFAVLLILGLPLLCRGAAAPDGLYCVGKREFFGKDGKGFDFRAPRFTLQNAYWLAVISYDAYSDGPLLLPEMKRWGFKDNDDPKSEDHLDFLSEDRTFKTTLLGSPITIPYADSQALWAENKDGVILAFRGTNPTVKADVITDLRVKYHPTREMGRIHLGFYSGLQIIWDDLFRHALKLRRRDFASRKAILDTLSALPAEKVDAELEKLTEWKIPLDGKKNFLKAWKNLKDTKGTDEQFDDLFKFLNTRWRTAQKPIWLTGHSMGGGLALIAAARLLANDFNVAGIYTYGSPRAGDAAFRHFVETKAFDSGIRENVVRFRNFLDAVTVIPPVTGLIDPIVNPEGWDDIGRLKYFPEKKDGKVEMWTDPLELTTLPQYIRDLPLERFGDWTIFHAPHRYIQNIEQMVFAERAKCN